MEKIVTALEGRKKPVTHLTRNSKLFKNILVAIKDKKGEDTVSLDLRKIDEAVADFFILCEAKSHVQVKAIADNIQDLILAECDEKPFHTEHGPQWTIIDYVNIVIHIFQHEHRQFYSLESLWADAERVEHKA